MIIIISSSIACAIPGHGCQPGRVSDDGQRLSKDIQVRCFTNQDIWELRGQDEVGSWEESGIKKKKKKSRSQSSWHSQRPRKKELKDFHQQVLLVLPSNCIQNLATCYHLHSHHPGPSLFPLSLHSELNSDATLTSGVGLPRLLYFK